MCSSTDGSVPQSTAKLVHAHEELTSVCDPLCAHHHDYRHSRCRDDPTKTAQNIEAIAKALHVLGKIVCVCTLPPSVPDQEQRNASVNATVKALVRRAYLEQSRGSDADAATKKEDQAALSWIVAGPNLGSSMFADASLCVMLWGVQH